MDALLTGIFSLVGAGAGSFLGAYLKKKGENVATHEDMDKLVDQMAAVTQTTKEIEAKISSDVWDRQKRWEIKRDAIFDMVKELGTLQVALGDFISVYRAAQANKDAQFYAQKKIEEHQKFQQVHQSFERAQAVAALVCSKEVQKVVSSFGVLRTQLTSDIAQGRMEKANKDFADVIRAGLNLRELLRQELLGVENNSSGFKSQSNATSS
jgi:hypothetical protein